MSFFNEFFQVIRCSELKKRNSYVNFSYPEWSSFAKLRYDKPMKIWSLILISYVLLWGCATKGPEQAPLDLEIVEITPNKWTAITKQNMLHLAQVYDLKPFLFTKKINIQSQVIPHSHPVLTINTRNAENPKKILSVWLHEELHWWSVQKSKSFSLAIKELEKIYPQAPVTKSFGLNSTFLHLVICHLELKALGFYLGDKEARDVITDIMKSDKIYPWIYYQVLYKDHAIKRLVKKYKLLPPPLN